ncbi:MAG TPA: hypothetical protein VFQ61_17450 [Polyangiaceae bacterium]|nr:hypothetical protein [Polyangiaceae bacterium]
MRNPSKTQVSLPWAAMICITAWGCSSANENGNPGLGESPGSTGGASGLPATAGMTSGGISGTTMSSGGSPSFGGASGATATSATGGSVPAGGTSSASNGGAAPNGGKTSAAGGALAGSGGASAGAPTTTSGGSNAGGATSPSGGVPGSQCTVGSWAMADPAAAGPFATITETNVGPTAGVGSDGAPVAFTLFRPKELGTTGLCHPVVTWGNGTGATPSLYKTLLNHLASHGFVVIASDSPNVADGSPPPMVAGVTWLIEQNALPASPLYQRIDVTHVGATGHSQGGFATSVAGGDSHVTTIAPLCGASPQRNLHGPALVFCGGMDTTVPCSTVQRAYDSTSNQPVMLASYLSADHANWITFRGSKPSPVEVAVTAWMRVHLMGDTTLRSWFYGADCKLCADTAWQVSKKMMD